MGHNRCRRHSFDHSEPNIAALKSLRESERCYNNALMMPAGCLKIESVNVAHMAELSSSLDGFMGSEPRDALLH